MRVDIRNLCVGPFNHSETVIETPSPPSCQAPLCGALGPQRKQLGPSAGADRLQLSCQGSSQPDLPSGKLKSPGYGGFIERQNLGSKSARPAKFFSWGILNAWSLLWVVV